MIINIRALTEQDTVSFRALRLRGLQEAPDSFGATYEEYVLEPLTTIEAHVRPNNSFPERFMLGAFDQENQLVGLVGFVRERRRKGRHKASVWGMYVAPEMRGQGIGKLLMQDLLQRATTIPGLEQIHLGVVTTNVVARSLYLASGFCVYGVEPHALKQDERYLDEELMVFSL